MNRKSNCYASFVLFIMLLLVMSLGVSAASLNKTKAKIKVGKSAVLKVMDAEEPVTFRSTKPSVVSVSSTGRIRGLCRGIAYVEAVTGDEVLRCKVYVRQPVTEVKLNHDSYFLMEKKKLQLTAMPAPQNANYKKITWSTSDKRIATVSQKGKVKALRSGAVTITAKAKSGVTAECKIYVLKSSVVNTTEGTTTSTTEAAVRTTKAKAFLATLERYSQRVQSDKKKGISWKYNQSSVPKTFEEAIQKKRRISTCSWLITWALKDESVGVLEYGSNLSSVDGQGGIWYGAGGNTKERITKYCTVIKNPSGLSLAELEKRGIIKPGDIMFYPGHLNVYAGNGRFYDGGRIGLNGCTRDNLTFDSFGPVNYWMSSVPVNILRIK